LSGQDSVIVQADFGWATRRPIKNAALPRQARKSGREENAFGPRSRGLGGGALQIGIAPGLLAFYCIVGTIPGSVYGSPEECWKGSTESILDINSALPAHFVITDGVVAMEGNGPLHGTARDLGRIVMSDDPVPADFTCARLMGFDPYRISHLAQAAQFLGNGDVQCIDQLGEKLPRTVRPFSVLPEFAHLIAGATS
jgi:hypothetical protein